MRALYYFPIHLLSNLSTDHLCFRYLFYTDWDTPAKIGRANMDGTDLTILINGSDIAWPNGLSVDYAENKIYWADAKIDRIESINLDGTGRTVMVPKTEHSFGLAVDNEYIYWTDWLTKSINRANKKNTSEIVPIRGEYGGLMDLQIYDKALQNGTFKALYGRLSENSNSCKRKNY